MNTQFLKPEQIITQFGLKKGDHIADFGAGHGYFTIPLARLVGEEGKVYAFDVQKEVLDIIRTKAQLEHLLNIELVRANLDAPQGSKLKDGVLDFVLISNLLFQSEARQTVLEEAARVLRKNTKMAVIEWDQSESALGPSRELRILPQAAAELALQTGFQKISEFAAGSHHYGLLFLKP